MIVPVQEKKVPNKVVRPQWLGDVACYDAKLAYTALQGGLAEGGYVTDTSGWEVLTLKATWGGPANTADIPSNTGVKGQLEPPGIVEADLWVRKVTYTVRRPVAFPLGGALRAQSDFFNMLNPNIDATLQINSFCRYFISPAPTPLELIPEAFSYVSPAGLVLRCSASIEANFANTRTFLALAGETEVNASITFHCLRLPAGVYGGCDEQQARAALRELGYLAQVR